MKHGDAITGDDDLTTTWAADTRTLVVVVKGLTPSVAARTLGSRPFALPLRPEPAHDVKVAWDEPTKLLTVKVELTDDPHAYDGEVARSLAFRLARDAADRYAAAWRTSGAPLPYFAEPTLPVTLGTSPPTDRALLMERDMLGGEVRALREANEAAKKAYGALCDEHAKAIADLQTAQMKLERTAAERDRLTANVDGLAKTVQLVCLTLGDATNEGAVAAAERVNAAFGAMRGERDELRGKLANVTNMLDAAKRDGVPHEDYHRAAFDRDEARAALANVTKDRDRLHDECDTLNRLLTDATGAHRRAATDRDTFKAEVARLAHAGNDLAIVRSLVGCKEGCADVRDVVRDLVAGRDLRDTDEVVVWAAKDTPAAALDAMVARFDAQKAVGHVTPIVVGDPNTGDVVGHVKALRHDGERLLARLELRNVGGAIILGDGACEPGDLPGMGARLASVHVGKGWGRHEHPTMSAAWRDRYARLQAETRARRLHREEVLSEQGERALRCVQKLSEAATLDAARKVWAIVYEGEVPRWLVEPDTLPACVEPEHNVYPCCVCGADVHTCDVPSDEPFDGTYPDEPGCPRHPDGCQLRDARWACSKGCWDVAMATPTHATIAGVTVAAGEVKTVPMGDGGTMTVSLGTPPLRHDWYGLKDGGDGPLDFATGGMAYDVGTIGATPTFDRAAVEHLVRTHVAREDEAKAARAAILADAMREQAQRKGRSRWPMLVAIAVGQAGAVAALHPERVVEAVRYVAALAQAWAR